MFKETYSTVDDVYGMKCLIDMFLSKKKQLFSAFIDGCHGERRRMCVISNVTK